MPEYIKLRPFTPLPRFDVDEERVKEVGKEDPVRSMQLDQQRRMAMGLRPVPNIHGMPTQESVESEPFWRTAKLTAFDMALFVGAGAIASVATGGAALPTIIGTGLLYGTGKAVQENISGEAEPTITETVSSKEFHPAARGMLHAAEAAALAGPGAKLIGGASGRILKGVEAISSKPLSALSKRAEPVTDWLMENILMPPTKIPIPGTGRTIRETFQPGVERLAKSPAVVETRASQTIRAAEVQKRHAMSTIEGLGMDLNAPNVSLMQRAEVIKGLTDPSALKTPEAKAIVERYRNRVREAAVKNPYKGMWEESWTKSLAKQVNQDLDFFEELFDPSVVHLAKEGLTKKTKKQLLEIVRNPTVNDDLREFTMDMLVAPFSVPSAIGKAAREAQMEYLTTKFIASKGLTSLTSKPGYELIKHGGLKGMWVPRDLRLQLDDMVKIEQYANRFGSKMLSAWKAGKTILRPAYHLRNVISNAILADFGGLPIYRVDIYTRAMKEMKAGHAAYKKFIKDTGGLATFTQDELLMLEGAVRGSGSALDMAWTMFRKVSRPGTKIQNAEENYFKYALYRYNTLEKGMSHPEAILQSQKYLLNYGEASVGAGFLRSGLGIFSPMPFATWFTKIIPLTVETAVKHPLRFGKWIMFGAALQNQAIEQVGLTEPEWEQIQENMPHWMSKGLYLLMPWRDGEGRLNMFNATFVMPGVGDFVELFNMLDFTSAGGLQVHNPAVDIVAAMKSKRKSSGAPLYFDWEPPATKYAKVASYAWHQLMPTMLGADWKQAHQIITEQEGAPSVEQAALSGIGIKLSPIDPSVLARKKLALNRIYEQEFMGQFRRDLRKAKTSKQRDKIIEKYREIRQKQYE